MESAGVIRLLLLTSILSLLISGGYCLFYEDRLRPQRPATFLDVLQRNKEDALISPNKVNKLDGSMAGLLHQYRIKKGGRAALVDLLDYMNKPKNRKEENGSTSASRESPVKPWSWEAMLYDED